MSTRLRETLPERSLNMRRCAHCGAFLEPKNHTKDHLKKYHELKTPCCRKSAILEFADHLNSYIIH